MDQIPLPPPPADTLSAPSAEQSPAWVATAAAARRPWRERVPELVAGIGATLVVVAVSGFLASTWAGFGPLEKALALATAAAVLTVAGLWADRADRLEPVIGACWAAATALTVGAGHLAGHVALPDAGRVAIAVAGLGGAVLAGVLLSRRRESLVLQWAAFAALLFAAGPPGVHVDATWSVLAALRLFAEPFIGLVDLGYRQAGFALAGGALVGIGVVWLGLARVLEGRAGTQARVLGVGALALAALQLQLTGPVGAVVALAVVIGFLIYGLVDDEAGLLSAGVLGCVVAGVRVLAAVFTGEELATLLVLGGGLAMLAWAFSAMRRRA